MSIIIELRKEGVKITPSTPQKIIEKFSQKYPELKKLKDEKAKDKKESKT